MTFVLQEIEFITGVNDKDIVCPNIMHLLNNFSGGTLESATYQATANAYGMRSMSSYYSNGLGIPTALPASGTPTHYVITTATASPGLLMIPKTITTTAHGLPFSQPIQNNHLDAMIQMVGHLKTELEMANILGEQTASTPLASVYSETLTVLARLAFSDLQKIALSAQVPGTAYYLSSQFLTTGTTPTEVLTAEQRIGLSFWPDGVTIAIGIAPIDPALYSNDASLFVTTAPSPLTKFAYQVLSMCETYNNALTGTGTHGVGPTTWSNQLTASTPYIEQKYTMPTAPENLDYQLEDGAALCTPVTLRATDSDGISNSYTLTPVEQKLFTAQIKAAFKKIQLLDHYAELKRYTLPEMINGANNPDYLAYGTQGTLAANLDYLCSNAIAGTADSTWDFMENIAHDVI